MFPEVESFVLSHLLKGPSRLTTRCCGNYWVGGGEGHLTQAWVFKEDFRKRNRIIWALETERISGRRKSVRALRVTGWRKRWGEGCWQEVEHM